MVVWKYIKNILGVILIVFGFYISIMNNYGGIWGGLMFVIGLFIIGKLSNEK